LIAPELFSQNDRHTLSRPLSNLLKAKLFDCWLLADGGAGSGTPACGCCNLLASHSTCHEFSPTATTQSVEVDAAAELLIHDKFIPSQKKDVSSV